MYLNIRTLNLVIWLILIIIIILCSIGIVIASIFQDRKNKKYKECLNIIKERGIDTLQVKISLTKEDINKIDPKVDVDKLMDTLYEIYLQFENKKNIQDTNFENILISSLQDFYINKLNLLKLKNIKKVNEDIELINYSIIEYSKEKLKFRITINCFSYKAKDNKVISGSNIEKVEKILIITYHNIDSKWLISNYENIYEKKLSD